MALRKKERASAHHRAAQLTFDAQAPTSGTPLRAAKFTSTCWSSASRRSAGWASQSRRLLFEAVPCSPRSRAGSSAGAGHERPLQVWPNVGAISAAQPTSSPRTSASWRRAGSTGQCRGSFLSAC